MSHDSHVPRPSDGSPGPEPRRPSGKDPADRPGHERILRRTVVKPAGVVPDPVDAAYVANRLTALTHELANLLDGSLRVISLARRSQPAETPEQLARHLDTVYAAMLQMAELVRGSMGNQVGVGVEGMRQALGAAGTLDAALRHAVNVMRPVAEERGIDLVCETAPELSEVAAGPIYGVVAGGVRNAIESIDRAGVSDGWILVKSWLESGKTGRCIVIDIIDNGEGPPSGVRPGRVFDAGFSTKPGGSGLGLSLSREVVEHLGGAIELRAREDGASGAALRIRYPVPSPWRETRIG